MSFLKYLSEFAGKQTLYHQDAEYVIIDEKAKKYLGQDQKTMTPLLKDAIKFKDMPEAIEAMEKMPNQGDLHILVAATSKKNLDK